VLLTVTQSAAFSIRQAAPHPLTRIVERWLSPRDGVVALPPSSAGLRLGETVALDLADAQLPPPGRLSSNAGLILAPGHPERSPLARG
jgi:hypothetical protein